MQDRDKKHKGSIEKGDRGGEWRLKRRHLLGWTVAALGIAAVDALLESKDAGLITAASRYLLEGKQDLYLRTIDKLEKLGFTIDQAHSVYFKNCRNLFSS